jgi:exodeoxyribonuclease VII large subunit
MTLPFEDLPPEDPVPAGSSEERTESTEERFAASVDDARPAPVAPEDTTYSVAEINGAIAQALADALPRQVWVRGEVAQLRVSGNGHVYFDLCEKAERRGHVRAKLSVALWRNDRASVNRTLKDAGVKLEDGVEVRVRGRVEHYSPNGRVQLIMTAVDPVFTVGKLAAERARVLQVLSAEGLLERQRALVLPLVPLRVGLVTSRDSAAYHDFVHELDASGHAFRVHPVDVRVQGQGADRRIMYGVRRLAAHDLDVIVLARGGGSRSDLAPFDSEQLARLVADLSIPVITGVGHEVDRTVADEVAHVAAKTPTAAAALLVEAVDDYCAQLARIAHRVSLRARSVCTLAGRDATDLGRRLARAVPVALARERHVLDRHRHRISERARHGIRDAGTRVDDRQRAVLMEARERLRTETARSELAAARLRLLDPQRVLERGYTITRTDDGRLLRAASEVGADTVLVTETADGSVRSKVVDE